MKIKKEYGEQVYNTALDTDNINEFIGELVCDVYEDTWTFNNGGFTCDIFTDDQLGCDLNELIDMWLYADEDLPRNGNKKDFFNKYVEGGYQEPLYYVKDKYTDQILCNVGFTFSNSNLNKWFDDVGAAMSEAKLLKHTKQEWLDINPAYEKMLVEVEE
ncbi:hypothetical protein [Lactobacillus terrae]|uniref:hypothetical protein n=1 Tax=Lactobacillus terrae TaxID=2269374 RepID=UPI000C1B63FC|nr:hypothetical protein [Lactobacillus terrae]